MALFANQQTVTTGAAALPGNASATVVVRAFSTNLIHVFIGASGVTRLNGYELPPAHYVTLSVANSNLIYVTASGTGTKICFIGT